MLSLRSFHIVFILLVIIAAELFGAWAIMRWRETHQLWLPWLAALSLIGGLGLAGYAGWFVRKLEKAHIS